MSTTVQIPWYLDKQTEHTIIQAEVMKNVLQTICQQHRFFQAQWLQQNTTQHLEIQELIEIMVRNEVYTTNRKEQISIALHCLHLWLTRGDINHDKYLKINQIGPLILSQLETKAGNRYYHDIKVYRAKNLIKTHAQKRIVHVRCYILEKRSVKLDYNYTGGPDATNSTEFNFNNITRSKLNSEPMNEHLQNVCKLLYHSYPYKYTGVV